MYQLSNFIDNDDIRTLAQLGPFQVIEYQRDLSVSPDSAQTAYFSSVMHVRRRQVLCDLKQANITLQAGAMQWSVGNVNATTGVKGVGDLFGKALRGKVTGESAIKPEYTGDGLLVLEPTYKHILLLDLADWNGSIVLDDGLFLACDARLKHKAVMRSNLSSAVAGNEGLFNLGITGSGGVRLSPGGAGGDHPPGRCPQGGRQPGGGLERQPELYRGAVRQDPDRVCCLRGGAGQRLSGHGEGPACPGVSHRQGLSGEHSGVRWNAAVFLRGKQTR